jgi:hypothetical protein
VIPRRIYDQPISNFPTESWFQEIAREDFNEPSLSLASPSSTPTHGKGAAEAVAALDAHQD